MMSRNTFPEPQPDSASYTVQYNWKLLWALPLENPLSSADVY